MKKIGLIGGLALRAGIYYYSSIAKQVGTSDLQLVLNHASVEKVLEFVASKRRADLGRYLARLADELADAGAELVAITAVAPHYAFAEAQAASKASLVNLLDVVPQALIDGKVARVAVFGNRAVVSSGAYGSISDELLVRLPPTMVDRIHDIYSAIALDGKMGTEPEYQLLDDIAGQIIREAGVDKIVLAGTDLSSFYATRPPLYPNIDLASLHISRIIDLSRQGV